MPHSLDDLIHPEMRKYLDLDDEGISAYAQAQVNRLSPQELDEWMSGWPTPPGTRDLVALEAPDGVTIAVFRGTADELVIRKTIYNDVISRYDRESARTILLSSGTPDDYARHCDRTVRRLKSRYKIVPLIKKS